MVWKHPYGSWKLGTLSHYGNRVEVLPNASVPPKKFERVEPEESIEQSMRAKKDKGVWEKMGRGWMIGERTDQSVGFREGRLG